MLKLRTSSLKFDTSTAIARKNTKGLIGLLGVVILGALMVVGQQRKPMPKKEISVTDRFENAIKAREPNFKLANQLVRNNRQEKYTLQGWKSDEDLVSATTYELASQEEAAKMLKKSLDAPMSVPVQTINLRQLGDEAYMRLNNYGKEGQTDLLFRKGNFVIIMSASTPDVVRRFAAHIANEIQLIVGSPATN